MKRIKVVQMYRKLGKALDAQLEQVGRRCE